MDISVSGQASFANYDNRTSRYPTKSSAVNFHVIVMIYVAERILVYRCGYSAVVEGVVMVAALLCPVGISIHRHGSVVAAAHVGNHAVVPGIVG